MAFSKAFLAVLVLSILTLHLVNGRVGSEFQQLTSRGAERSLLQAIDCGEACTGRCQLSKRPNLCKRACGSCCAKCSCVPPGTSGNYDQCPCYANLTTHGGQHKCP